jgi:PAS domain S-box-containing protein
MSDNNRGIVEDALQTAENMPSFLLDKLPDPIFVFSREGRCLYANEIFSRKMGKSKEQIIGKTIDQLFDISIEDSKNIFYDMYEVFQNGRE